MFNVCLLLLLCVNLIPLSISSKILLLLFLVLNLNGRSKSMLGVLVPVAGALGSGTLLCIALCYLVTRKTKILFSDLAWCYPFLAIIFTWSLGDFIFTFDFKAFEFYLNWAKSAGVAHALVYQNSELFDGLQQATRYLVLVVLFNYWRANSKPLEVFTQELLVGVYISIIIALAFIAKPDFINLPNQNEYWHALHRLSASFSDPNAFGVAIALLLPFVANTQVAFKKYILILLLLIVASFSGSRSFFLGVLIYLVMFAYPKGPRIFASLIVILGLGVLLISVDQSLIMQEVQNVAPVGISRLLKTLNLANWYDNFYSRLVFLRIGLSVWFDNLMIGVGFHEFRSVVPIYARALSIPIGAWSDNANNFYLGLAAELGCLGMASFAWSLSNLTWRNKGKWAKYSLICFLILLVVGPHLEFDEVCVLVAFLMACSLEVHSRPRLVFLRVLTSVASIFFLLKCYYADRGLYAWEQNDLGLYRWSARKAQLTLNCSSSGQTNLYYRATNPDLAALPLNIRLKTHSADDIQLDIKDTALKQQVLSCKDIKSGTTLSKIQLELDLSRVWIPRNFGMGQDTRSLGVQIYYMK